MKGSDVRWITTGRYIGAAVAQGKQQYTSRANATLLNRGLKPLDQSGFLDQFRLFRKSNGKFDKDGPQRVGSGINATMETAALEPTAHNCMALLESVFGACRQMCVSVSFQEKLPCKRASFFKALPMEEWDELLNPLEFRAEFGIARSLAFITGLRRQSNGDYSIVQPMLGSFLPLTRRRSGWMLAMEYDPLALLHGFQISVKDKLTFVGLRSPRAITASILGLNCQRITIPGVRFDPIGTGDAGQAVWLLSIRG